MNSSKCLSDEERKYRYFFTYILFSRICVVYNKYEKKCKYKFIFKKNEQS